MDQWDILFLLFHRRDFAHEPRGQLVNEIQGGLLVAARVCNRDNRLARVFSSPRVYVDMLSQMLDGDIRIGRW